MVKSGVQIVYGEHLQSCETQEKDCIPFSRKPLLFFSMLHFLEATCFETHF